MKTFRWELIWVNLDKRWKDDDHILVWIDTEDDWYWHKSWLIISSSWLDELIEQLQIAKKYMETQEPDIYKKDWKQYWYKFKTKLWN